MAKTDRTETSERNRDYELAAHQHLGSGELGLALAPGVFEKLVDQVKTDPAFTAYEADSDADVVAAPGADTNNTPPMPAPLRYGEGDHDYVAITNEGGEIAIRDGNDPSGKVWRYSIQQWTAFVRAVRGDDDQNERKHDEWVTDPSGQRRSNPTGAQLHERTMDKLAADKAATPDAKADRPGAPDPKAKK